ncbi:MAG: 50S ribosomal protein L10 [Desulfohalobium sp.]
MNRAEKAQVIHDLHDKAQKASIALVTDFRGLKVEELNELRSALRASNVDYQVVKNTLARIALEDSPHALLKDEFQDTCAVAFGYDDPVVAAKELADFAKKHKKFGLRFGSLEGKYLDADQIRELSELPGHEELLGKLLGTFNAVPTQFVGLFANLLRNLMYALKAIEDQKQQG